MGGGEGLSVMRSRMSMERGREGGFWVGGEEGVGWRGVGERRGEGEGEGRRGCKGSSSGFTCTCMVGDGVGGAEQRRDDVGLEDDDEQL